jgi:hypothetical protein
VNLLYDKINATRWLKSSNLWTSSRKPVVLTDYAAKIFWKKLKRPVWLQYRLSGRLFGQDLED